MRILVACCVAAAGTLPAAAGTPVSAGTPGPAVLTASAIQASVAALAAAEVRRDWPAVQAAYAPGAQIFGLYYDKDHEPAVHDGAAAADMRTMAALTTVRRKASAAVVPGAVTLAPGGQRATVSTVRIDEYDQGATHVHRTFDETAIVILQGGAVKFVQVVSVERPRQ